MRLTLLFLAFGLVTLHAQTEYNFSVLEGEYEPLTQADTLSNGEAWSSDDFYFTTPFDVNIFGLQGRKWRAMQGAIRMDTTVNDTAMNVVASGFATNLVSQKTQPESSPVLFSILGLPGERQVVIEYKNARFQLLDGMTDFVNFQIRYYEMDRSIEIHYGPSQTDAVQRESDEMNIVFGGVVGLALGDSTDLIDAYLLNGFAANPMVVRRNEVLQGFPENDMIFRFSPATTSTESSLPHPCQEVDNFALTGNIDVSLDMERQVRLYDINGHLLHIGRNLTQEDLRAPNRTPTIGLIQVDGCREIIKTILR